MIAILEQTAVAPVNAADFQLPDARLSAVQGTVDILRDLSSGRFAFSAHSDHAGLYLSVQWNAGRLDFYFEDCTGNRFLEAFHVDAEGHFRDTFALNWTGPWVGTRPMLSPIGVAGLVVSVLGTWHVTAGLRA